MTKDFNAFEQFRNDEYITSMAVFYNTYSRLMRLAGVASVCEIGVEFGINTQLLMDYCDAAGGRYVGIDTAPDQKAVDGIRKRGHEIFIDTSLNALKSLPAFDAYFIDGDHNYYTVSNELALIDRAVKESRAPLIFLHDVGWPTAYRDAYYSLDNMPQEGLNDPLSNKDGGPCPGDDEIKNGGGYWHDGNAYWASKSGGEKNGVLKAVEDFMSLNKRRYSHIVIPVHLGLGIIWSKKKNAYPENFDKLISSLVSATELLDDTLRLVETKRISFMLDSERVKWMESSRFWKAHDVWMKIKDKSGLSRLLEKIG